jgi:signal transduction histidine kinase
LYLVKSHVESLGGKIAIESEVEKGTKFIIHFKIEPDVEQYLAN